MLVQHLPTSHLLRYTGLDDVVKVILALLNNYSNDAEISLDFAVDGIFVELLVVTFHF